MKKLVGGLAGILLGCCALPQQAQAETREVNIDFTNSLQQMGFKGEKKQGTLTMEASQYNNTLRLVLTAANCKMAPDSFNIRIAIPYPDESENIPEIEIIEIRQSATMATISGLKHEVSLKPASGLEKAGRAYQKFQRFGLDLLIGQNAIADLGRTTIEKLFSDEETRQERLNRKVGGLYLAKIPTYLAEGPDLGNISRTIEIDLSANPKRALAIVSTAVGSDAGIRLIKEEVVNFKEKPGSIGEQNKRYLTEVPVELRKYVFRYGKKDPIRFQNPAEISKLLGKTVKDSYFLEYDLLASNNPDKLDKFIVYTFAIGQKDARKKNLPEIGAIAGNLLRINLPKEEEEGIGKRVSGSFPPFAEASFETENYSVVYMGFFKDSTIKRWQRKEETLENIKSYIRGVQSMMLREILTPVTNDNLERTSGESGIKMYFDGLNRFLGL